MSERFEFNADRSGDRLDSYAAGLLPDLSRSYVQRLIADGNVTVNGQPAKVGLKLKSGDCVTVVVPPPTPSIPQPEDIPLNIAYEDDDLMVVDKPPGLVVHPAPGQPCHTLVNAVLAHCPGIAVGGSERPGIVHRLDKNTSGLLVVAKNGKAHASLAGQLKSRSMLKRYLVLVHGRLSPEEGAIEAPIGRDPHNRKRMAVVSSGREARTRYRVLDYLDGYTLLEVTLETGRTHQIRVHLSAAGFPVAGDEVYGRRAPHLARQFVHASHLGFMHPSSGEWVGFDSKLPSDLEDALGRISQL